MRLTLIVVVACASPRHVAAPSPSVTGMIAGEIDEIPGEPAPGATIVATNGSGAQSVISDDQGHYEVAVPPGTYRVTVYYNEDTIELGPRVVVAGATVRADTLLEPLARCQQHHRKLAGTQAERDAVATAALERFLRDRSTIPGGERLPLRAILVELDGKLSMGALPVTGARFVPATHALLDELAAHEPVPYIRFTKLSFVGDCAVVELGVAFAGAKDAATNARELYQLADDGVMFRGITARPLPAAGE